MGAHGTKQNPSPIWKGDSRGSWSQINFGVYLPMDHGMLLMGSVWSPFEVPQSMQAEGC